MPLRCPFGNFGNVSLFNKLFSRTLNKQAVKLIASLFSVLSSFVPWKRKTEYSLVRYFRSGTGSTEKLTLLHFLVLDTCVAE